LSAIVAALGPVFALIVLGYGLKRFRIPRGSLGERFWPAAENLTYYLLLPSLLFLSLARADLGAVAFGPLAGSLAGAILAVSGLVLIARPWLRLPGPSFSSVFQAAIRPNTYVGEAPVFALWGHDGLALLAVAIVSVIPLVNVLSVVAVSRFAASERPPRPAALIRLVLQNPLIIACLLGVLASLIRLPLPDFIQTVLQWLGTAAMPIGLLTVGAALDLSAVRGAIPIIALTGTVKLVLFPAITALIGAALGLSGTALNIALFYGGLPISASAYVLARLLGGDAALIAGVLTATTLGAFLTLPVLILILS
jgi:predicted permease